MAVKARVTVGARVVASQSSAYAYSQDAMPSDIADTSAGVGQVSATVPVWPGSRRSAGLPFTVAASNLPDGGVTGATTDPVDDGVNVTLTAFSVLGRLNTVKRLAPFSGSVSGAITAFFTAAGITDYSIDPSFDTPTVNMLGFKDNLWVKLREMAAVYRFNTVASGTHVDVVPRSTVVLDVSQASSKSWGETSTQLAQAIEVICYNTTPATRVCYPAGAYDSTLGGSTADGWSMGAQVIQVGYRSTTTIVAQVNASLTSVLQPTCAKTVDRDDNTGAHYTVLGMDQVKNKAVVIDPAVWAANGGSVSAVINEDGQSVTITVSSGANPASLAPYSIAATDGDSTWSTLRITGTGVFYSKTKYTFPTGLPVSLASTDVGATVDSIFVGTVAQVYDVAAAVLPLYAAPFRTVTYHLDDVHGVNPPAYNLIAGSRVKDGAAMFRVQSVVISPTGIDVTAQQATTFDDHNKTWAGKTFADWNAFWADGANTWQSFAGEPLAH